MLEILEILKGQVSIGLDGVAVLRVMVERRVLPLKWWAHLLCDYVGAKEPTHEAVEELEDDVIVQQMARWVTIGVMVTTRCVVVAFLVSCHPDLVSHPFLCSSPCPWPTSIRWSLT